MHYFQLAFSVKTVKEWLEIHQHILHLFQLRLFLPDFRPSLQCFMLQCPKHGNAVPHLLNGNLRNGKSSLELSYVSVALGNLPICLSQPIDTQGTKPIIVAGRTLVPIRAVIEAFGGSVAWESSTRKVTVTLGKDSLDLWIDKPQASLNGIALAIDAANTAVVPIITNSGTIDKSIRLTRIDSRLDLVAMRHDKCVNLGLERFNRYLV